MEFLDPNAFIMDIPTDLNVEKVAEWRRNGILIVDIDDPHDRRLEANLVFYPPVPKVGEMSWTGFEGELFVGWEWVILRKQFAASPVRQRKKIGEPPTILVTMGGSDPHGLTLKTIEALEGLREAFRTIVVTGRGFSERKELARIQNRSSRFFEIREDVRDMASLMSQADIAVASFGVTAYELAAVGLPAIFLCLNEDHFRHAQLFVDMGVALNLGIHNTVEVSMIRKEIGNLLSHRDRLNTMACRTKGIVDGQGAKRIAKLITTRSAVKDV
jgi:spore coat polysaccharide biosynthesis predicted glycosyltransferase SpsG